MKKFLFLLFIFAPSIAIAISVTIMTSPPQSLIYVNGTLVGQTNTNGTLTVNINAFSNIKVENIGYLSSTFSYDPASNATFVNVTLQPVSYISVVTSPQKASITLDGNNTFLSPATITISAGPHTIMIKKAGYIPQFFSLSALPFQITFENIVLQQIGDVKFTSIPSGAFLFIDDQYIGKTPISTVLSAGYHTISADATGFLQSSTSLSIGNNATPQTIVFKLAKLVNVTIDSSPSNATFSLNGRTFITPQSMKIPAGTYTYSASLTYFQTATGTLKIEKDGTYTIFMHPMLSLVAFSSNPQGAAVMLDGKLIGQTQMTMQIPYGSYDVKMIGNDGKMWFGSVNVNHQVVNVYGDMLNAGMLLVNATPALKTIVHVGQIWTDLPATLTASVGIYPVEFFNPNYPVKTVYVNINGGAVTNVYEYLQPIASLFVESSPLGATVTLNGQFIGKTPIFNFKTLQGNYNLKVSWNDGFSERQVSLRNDQNYIFSFNDPTFVEISFLSYPDPVKVFVDDRNEGYTPCSVRLSRGIHSYRIYNLIGDLIENGILQTTTFSSKTYFFVNGG